MARPARHWPNAEKHLAAWLTAKTGHPAWTERPANYTTALPAYKVTRVGTTTTTADPFGHAKTYQLEVEVFASSRPALWSAVQALETAMDELAANGTDAWFVDDVQETYGAAIVDDENDAVRKASATYGVTVRPLT